MILSNDEVFQFLLNTENEPLIVNSIYIKTEAFFYEKDLDKGSSYKSKGKGAIYDGNVYIRFNKYFVLSILFYNRMVDWKNRMVDWKDRKTNNLLNPYKPTPAFDIQFNPNIGGITGESLRKDESFQFIELDIPVKFSMSSNIMPNTSVKSWEGFGLFNSKTENLEDFLFIMFVNYKGQHKTSPSEHYFDNFELWLNHDYLL